jgi:hypothetical protein
MKTIKSVAIYFSDLTKERQDELLKLFCVANGEEMNWNLYPIVLVIEPLHADDGICNQKDNRKFLH